MLHGAAQILADDARPFGDVLAELVSLLPTAWQYPGITAARIAVGELDVRTINFQAKPWLLQAAFTTSEGQHGIIEIVYLEARPAGQEGPFLARERSLIEALAQMVRASMDRRLAWHGVQRRNAELERQVASRSAALEAATRALEGLTYSVAHDLKAPLRGIDGYSRVLLEDYSEQLDDEGRGFLHNIRAATHQMNALIDELLAYSRLERRTLSSDDLSLPKLVAALVEERRADLENGHFELTVTLDCPTIVADADAVAQALRNYLDNAIKFCRSADRPRIQIGAQPVGACCRIWVRDNGIGFDMRHQDRIFEIFERLHRADHHPGTGIGLAIARKAAERLGGRAWAESAPGAGAVFYLEIPVWAAAG
jgi:signal transduction histidine kinase